MPDGDRHDWNDAEHYFDAHFGCLADFIDHFLLEDTIKIDVDSETALVMEGRLVFDHGLFIDVFKLLEINEHHQVRTVKYSYHAGVIGRADRPIFRYDNSHAHPGHADEHHCHRYHHLTWSEIRPPEWISHDGWPTLSEVITELQRWWDEVGIFILGGESENEDSL